MRKILTLAAVAGLAFTATPAVADGHEGAKPEKLEQDWYRVNLMTFKRGNRQRVGEIIEMYQKASDAAGTPKPIQVHMDTGPYTMMVFWKMQHGIEQMGWKDTPEGKKWDKAFFEMVGGEEAARKIFAEFQSYIQSQESHVGHIHREKDDG